MTTAKRIPATQNEAWGFCGAMNEDAVAAWPLAVMAIAGAIDADLGTIQIFLDSRHGRHFADDVLNKINAGQAVSDAINAATTQWMTWTINRHTAKEYGIPRGLPYLTGFVMHCGIAEEMAA